MTVHVDSNVYCTVYLCVSLNDEISNHRYQSNCTGFVSMNEVEERSCQLCACVNVKPSLVARLTW